MLLHLYATNSQPASVKLDHEALQANGGMNGRPNGHAIRPNLDQRARDAEEFELEGLISGDESSDDLRSPNPSKAPETAR